jgi:hypothetical protein
MSEPPSNDGVVKVAVTARFEPEIEVISGAPAFEAKTRKVL